jgi:PIN domain nuclease of toxin-antitoxin system
MIEQAGGVLLDTCAAIWLMNGELSSSALAQIVAAGSQDAVYVSPISAWEIGMLARPKPGRGAAPQFLPDPTTWFAMLMARPGVKPALLTPSIAIDASFLPGELHSDPADRLIIATSRAMRLPLATGDGKIIAYGRAGHIDVIAC